MTAANLDPSVAIVSGLQGAGTGVVFGVPGGGANLDVVGAAIDHGLSFVLCHQETAGAIMAATYGEVSGRPGACLATRGPGAASMVNGVAHAHLDRVALLAISESVAHRDRARVSHQQVDHRALFAPVTKAALAIGPEGGRSAVASALSPPTAYP